MGEADKCRRPCTKRFRLALWWLSYRLPVLDGINREAEELGRKHCKYSEEAWARDRADFKSLCALAVKSGAYLPPAFSMIYRLCETHLANLSLNIFAKWKQTEAFMNKTYCEKMQFSGEKWCARKDSNLHAFWAQPPQGCVSTNSTTSAS